MMLESTDNIRLYAFTDASSKESAGSWWPLADATSGKSFELEDSPEDTLIYLEEILNSEICF